MFAMLGRIYGEVYTVATFGPVASQGEQAGHAADRGAPPCPSGPREVTPPAAGGPVARQAGHWPLRPALRGA